MANATPTDTVSKRYDFVLLFDVQDGNPNGDPDNGNLPRVDPQTLQGIVTDVCLKRKVRNAISVIGAGAAGMELFFQTQDAIYESRILNKQIARAFEQQGIAMDPKTDKPKADEKDAKKKADSTVVARKWMCKQFFDIRAFGAVMSTGANAGQVRGPVQMTFGRSIDAIIPLEYSITRKAITTTKEAEDQARGDGSITGTMGRKYTIPYGLYRCSGFINPYLAKDTGFSNADLDLLWAALKGTMWEIDRSASRGLMATRGLYVFEHDTALGNAPAHELFELIDVPALGADKAPRSFKEYAVTVGQPPKGVTFHRYVG